MMTRLNSKIFIPILMVISWASQAQTNSDSSQHKRLKPLIIGSSVAYAGALISLNTLWYSDFERESFHFFNDHNEWKQLDKAGHFFSGFHLSQGGYKTLRWAGLNEKKALLWGTLFSAMVLTPIEVFDGFSSGYGASYSDLIANTTGASLFFLQHTLWNDIKIHPKFSFSRTEFASKRPDLLGAGLNEEILKDYNGQTYWFSLDISKIIKSPFPKWLNIAIGYSATNLVAANDAQSKELGYDPYRQYFLAIDFDFNEYKSRSKVVNTLVHVINMIHLPAPALEYGKKLKFHIAYY